MPRKIDRGEEETFFHIQIVDAELGRIRFGPFTIGDFDSLFNRNPKYPKSTPQEIAQVIQADIKNHGLVTALTNLGIYGGFEVRLTGDDGTNINVWEVEAP